METPAAWRRGGTALVGLALAALLAAGCGPGGEEGGSDGNAEAGGGGGQAAAAAGGGSSGAAAPSRPAPPAAPALHTIPAETTFTVVLDVDLMSDTAAVDQVVMGRVASAVTVAGRTLIPSGARVRGVVAEVKPAKRFGGQAMVGVRFDSVSLGGGVAVPVEGTLAAYAKKETAKDAGTIAGGAVGGAVLGKVLGKEDKDAALGAIIGGGIATAIASRRGEEAYLPAGTETQVRTTQLARVPAT